MDDSLSSGSQSRRNNRNGNASGGGGGRKMNGNHLLNFSMPSRVEAPPAPRRSRKTGGGEGARWQVFNKESTFFPPASFSKLVETQIAQTSFLSICRIRQCFFQVHDEAHRGLYRSFRRFGHLFQLGRYPPNPHPSPSSNNRGWNVLQSPRSRPTKLSDLLRGKFKLHMYRLALQSLTVPHPSGPCCPSDDEMWTCKSLRRWL